MLTVLAVVRLVGRLSSKPKRHHWSSIQLILPHWGLPSTHAPRTCRRERRAADCMDVHTWGREGLLQRTSIFVATAFCTSEMRPSRLRLVERELVWAVYYPSAGRLRALVSIISWTGSLDGQLLIYRGFHCVCALSCASLGRYGFQVGHVATLASILAVVKR